MKSLKGILEVIVNKAHWDSGMPDTRIGVTWDFTTMAPKETVLNSWDDVVDSDPNPLALECYKIYRHNKALEGHNNYTSYITSRPENSNVGDTVMVLTGRLAPRGAIGEIVSVYQTNWGPKFTIRDQKHEYRVYAKNCEVLAVAWIPHPREVVKPYPVVTDLEKAIYE